MSVSRVAAALLVWPMAVFPQAIVEYGAGVGRAGVAGAGLAAAGKSTSKLLEKSIKGMEPVQSKKAKVVAQVEEDAELDPTAKIPPPESKTPAIDLAAIPLGMDREELFRQFGKPSTRITYQQGGDVLEKCWYKAPWYTAVVVTLRNGKVESVGT